MTYFKKLMILLSCISIGHLITNKTLAQVTTIVNYDFNSVSSYPVQPTATASNITCSGSSSEGFQTYTGTATGSSAFAQNSTSGNALAMVNSGGTNTRHFLFQLGGSDLNSYSAYSLYLQPQRSSTGATTITVAYSTSGSSYTNLPTTYTVGTSFSETLIDLSSITALNYANAVYIKLMVSGASQTTGTIRIDNFEIQATKGFANGNPWQVNGYDVSFGGKLGIGMTNPLHPLEVTGTSAFHGNQTIEGNQDVTGNVIARQGLTFDGVQGIKYAPNANGGGIFKYGNNNTEQPLATPCATGPQAWANHQFGGMMQIYNSDSNGYIPGHGLLNFQTWEGGSSIDASIGGNTGSGKLLLNYFCGNDVAICAGPNGGYVRLGKNTSIGMPSTNDASTALDIKINSGIDNALKITNPNAVSTTTNKTVFEVNKDGQVFIGTGRTSTPTVYQLTVDGAALAKQVHVSLNAWADDVFKVDYKLTPLKEVEKYYTTYKHLPEVPSEKEVIENGIDVGDMQKLLLKKIEELTLYTVELSKQVNDLKTNNTQLQNQVNELKNK